MTWGYEERRRRERHYRVMFKCALAFCAIGVAVALLGAAEMLMSGDGRLCAFGLMLSVLSAVSAWLSVDSTVRIIELDVRDSAEES